MRSGTKIIILPLTENVILNVNQNNMDVFIVRLQKNEKPLYSPFCG